MKTQKVLTVLFLSISMLVRGQTGTTSFGTGAGTAGNYNSNLGYNAGNQNSTGTNNSFLGYYAGYSNTTSSNNGLGCLALRLTTSGDNNCALGYEALFSNTTGYQNTAIGYAANYSNTTAILNTSAGTEALKTTSTGGGNAAAGYRALYATNFNYGTAAGANALRFSSGGGLTGAGYQVGYNNATGNNLTLIGASAMFSNTSGVCNTAVGYQSQYSSVSGSYNTSDGFKSLYYATGSQNTAFGFQSGPNAASPALTNTTSLGNGAVPTASNTVMLGNSSLVYVYNTNGYNTFSDGRFKTDVREDVAGLTFVTQLRPITYLLDFESLDKHTKSKSAVSSESRAFASNLRRTGFIAQEIDAAQKKSGRSFSGVWTPKNENDIYRVDYTGMVVPLIKATQELNISLASGQQQLDSISAQIKTTIEKRVNMAGMIFPINVKSPSANAYISMSIPTSVRRAAVMICDMDGSQIKSIVVNERGMVSVNLSTGTLGAGLYLCSLIADDRLVDSKKMIFSN